MKARFAVIAACCVGALGAQQRPSPGALAQMSVNVGEVRIGADEHGRSELCAKLAEMRREGFPVTPAAESDALAVHCQGRLAKVFLMYLSNSVAEPKKAVCEYASAPATLAYDRVDWITLRRGGLPMTGEEIGNRLEPLNVRSLAALLFAFGFERIDAQGRGGKTLITAPLHQIDGFCGRG